MIVTRFQTTFLQLEGVANTDATRKRPVVFSFLDIFRGTILRILGHQDFKGMLAFDRRLEEVPNTKYVNIFLVTRVLQEILHWDTVFSCN